MKFDIILIDDISTGSTKRLAAKAIVDTMDKQKIKDSIPFWVKQLRLNEYSKPKTKERFGQIPYKVIYLNLYTHIRQSNYGLPFCIIQWISEEAEIKPQEITHNDSVDDFLIQWSSFHDTLDSMIRENEIPREEFLSKTKFFTNQALEITLELQKQKDRMLNKEISVSEFKENALYFKEKLDSLENRFIGFPESYDDNLVRLQHASKNAISSVHNVIVVVTNKSYPDSNIAYLVTMYIEESMREFNEYFSILKNIG